MREPSCVVVHPHLRFRRSARRLGAEDFNGLLGWKADVSQPCLVSNVCLLPQIGKYRVGSYLIHNLICPGVGGCVLVVGS